MYVINKIVGWLTSPLGVLFIGSAISWLLTSRKNAKLRVIGRILIGTVFAILWFLSCNIATWVIGLPLEGEEEPEDAAPKVEGCDAVVILGGGVGVHRKCGRLELFGGADRIWQGARVWKACNDRSIKLVMGGGTDESFFPLLDDFGIPRESVVFISRARNTQEESKMIADSGAKRIILVTSAWHMPRAKMLFERAGLEVIPRACDYEMHFSTEQPVQFSDFIPSPDCSALCRNSAALKEWVGRLGYWVLRK